MTEETVVVDRDLTSDDFEVLKKVRNSFLSMTDMYMLLDDLPQSIIDKVTAFRNTVRNMDTKFGTEWTKESHVQWPEVPTELIPKVPEPFIPPPGMITGEVE
jgi:hypothetical protein